MVTPATHQAGWWTPWLPTRRGGGHPGYSPGGVVSVVLRGRLEVEECEARERKTSQGSIPPSVRLQDQTHQTVLASLEPLQPHFIYSPKYHLNQLCEQFL